MLPGFPWQWFGLARARPRIGDHPGALAAALATLSVTTVERPTVSWGPSTTPSLLATWRPDLALDLRPGQSGGALIVTGLDSCNDVLTRRRNDILAPEPADTAAQDRACLAARAR